MLTTRAARRPLDYRPGPDVEDRRAVLASYLRRHNDHVAVRARTLGDEPFDPAVWRHLTAEMGIAAALVPEAAGGLGLGPDDHAMVAMELGRVLYAGPSFGTCAFAVPLLLALSERESLAALAGGGATGALAALDGKGRWLGSVATVAARRPPDGGWTLDGEAHGVLGAATADVLLVVAGVDGRTAVFRVDPAAVTVEDTPGIDPTRPMGTVRLRGSRAELLADGPEADSALAATLRLAQLALAAESVGGARECLRLTVEYAKVRQQFGRPIGAFQAVKHTCADDLILIERADAVLMYACAALDEGSPEAPRAVLAAKAAATSAFLKTAADGIQLHGTYGFTREAVPQSFFRRARWASLYLGTVAATKAELGGHLW